jgi:hypothetical protein
MCIYMYVVYFVMYDSVLILLLSYEHHDLVPVIMSGMYNAS